MLARFESQLSHLFVWTRDFMELGGKGPLLRQFVKYVYYLRLLLYNVAGTVM